MNDAKKRMKRAAKKLGPTWPKWIDRLWAKFPKTANHRVEADRFTERLLSPDECKAELSRRLELLAKKPQMAFMPERHAR